MPKNIQKSLSDYLSKIKTSRSQIHLPSKKLILRGCKHLNTPSFSMDDKRNKKNDNEATLDDIYRFLFENFRSLFLGDAEEINNNNNGHKVHNNTHGKSLMPSRTSFDSFGEPSPGLGGSTRFFVTHGFSGPSSSTATPTKNGDGSCSKETTTFPNNYVAVIVPCTKSPYKEFKRSMEDMVGARLKNDEKVDWDFMEELLFSYMNMNEKKAHKFILAAYVDVINLMRNPPQPALAKSVRTVRIGKEIRKKAEGVKLD
ncbi:transcription repressor OFP14-like [Lotus japonicus]|uniref:transcription repressor OFP14-like n=1 Tax=Lotus japonicus TaxID=34305 RepID=UPI0025855447|nr:transcription repressor OFP14-like [Lotus japonicus]XP_057452864.1 transcription repressor OFP14-like [Lotus japonicus]